MLTWKDYTNHMKRLELFAQQITGNEKSQYAYKKIAVEIKEDAALGLIYMNSPKDLNSLGSDMKDDLSAALTYFDSHPSVKVIVLLSRVPKAFCAGANIK